jgi:hypothetical protein
MDDRTTRILVWVAIAPPLLMDALYLGFLKLTEFVDTEVSID